MRPCAKRLCPHGTGSAKRDTGKCALPRTFTGEARFPNPGESFRPVHWADGPGARSPAWFRASARAEAASDRLRRRRRARGARPRRWRSARSRRRRRSSRSSSRPDDGPDDARGAGHPGKVAALASKAIGRTRASGVPSVAADLRLPEPRPGRRRALEAQRQGRFGRDVVSVRPIPDRGRSCEESAGVVDQGADEVDMVIDRGAFLSGSVREGLRRDRAREGSLRRRAPEGDPRGRRARHLRQRAPSVAPRDGRRAPTSSRPRPASSPGAATLPVTLLHARGDPRRVREDGPYGRDETGRRHPAGQAGGAVPRPAARDARPGLADAGPLSAGRLVASERRPDADAEGEVRAATRARTTSPLTDSTRNEKQRRYRRSGRTPCAGITRRRLDSRPVTATSSAVSGFEPSETLQDDLPGDRGDARRGRFRRLPTRSRGAVAAAREAFENGWSGIRTLCRAAKYLFRRAVSCRSARASSPCWSR